jgi:UDP-GlcNAc:undecaprenyl-phosphate GlcNAc-1-phosphate transferase
MTFAYLSFLTAAVLVLALLPLFAQMARRVGLVDKPDNTRKLHKTAIPLVGGLTVFVSGIIAVVVALVFGKVELGGDDPRELLGLLAASTVLVIVGVLDDRFNLRGRQKLFGQIIAVTLLILTGYQFTEFVLIYPIRFGIFSVLVIYAWCLVAINAMNLLDGADGFASTIGIVSSLAMGILAVFQGKYVDATICLALAGGLLGFLRYNFPPAKAYLGDTGSMLIGLVLAAVAIRSSFKQAALYSVAAPVAMLAIPFIDTTAAIIRRRFTGRSIYHEDRGHMHHVMAKRGLGPVTSLVWVALLCATTAIGGVLAIVMRQSEYAIISIALVLFVMVTARIFGRAESELLYRKLSSIAKSFLSISNRKEQRVVETAVQIQGQRAWEDSWLRLVDFASEHELNQITLDVNAPWMHEAYHADWKKSGVRTSPSQQWQVELPLIVSNRILGRVNVKADRTNRIPHHDVVLNLMKLTSDIENSILDAEQIVAQPAPAVSPESEPVEPVAETVS